MFGINLTALTFVLKLYCVLAESSNNRDNQLLIILADGFRWDYLTFGDFPNLRHFETNGVKAQYMEPVFPTNTYPNMYSLVTGLYAEDHGMVDNVMLSEDEQDWFLMHPHPNASHEHWWQHAEPLWITAEKSGVRSAAFWWFGCEVPIGGIWPTIYEPPKSVYSWPTFYKDVTVAVNNITEIFANKEANLVLLYYEDLDYRGHKYGPESDEIKVALHAFDSIIGQLWMQLNAVGLRDRVNIILVSDHGMSPTQESVVKYVDLSIMIDANDVKYMMGLGSSAGIMPMPEKLDKVYEDLKHVEGIKVYKKENIPEKFHVRKSKLVAPIYITADEGYFIKKLFNNATKWLQTVKDDLAWRGFHGYDPEHTDEMHAVFTATGPAFKTNFQTAAIKTVDVYNLFCNILGLTPNPNNGTWDSMKDMLIETTKNVRSGTEL